MVKFCFASPAGLIVLNLVDLGHNELVPDLSQRWKVGYFFLEHQKDHSSLRWANFCSSLLPVVETQVLKILLVQEIDAACSSAIIFNWVVSPVRIRSLSLILWHPSHSSRLFWVIKREFHIDKVNSPWNYLNFLVRVFAWNRESLVVKFKL